MKAIKSLISGLIFVSVVYLAFMVVAQDYNPWKWHEAERTYFAMFGIFFGIIIVAFVYIDQSTMLSEKIKQVKKTENAKSTRTKLIKDKQGKTPL